MNHDEIKAKALAMAAEHGFSLDQLALAHHLHCSIRRLELSERLAKDSLREAKKLHRKCTRRPKVA